MGKSVIGRETFGPPDAIPLVVSVPAPPARVTSLERPGSPITSESRSPSRPAVIRIADSENETGPDP
ncbi:MAG: hypothetical protein CMJ23_05045 [Phycisphaerae bacterium]|nr:hypothetical protein [Phycisphaerae bacterium]